jgi:curli production assembly/transport component CsgG
MLIFLLPGCSLINQTTDLLQTEPEQIRPAPDELRPPKNGVITVAVYRFSDQTGQRRYSDRIASLSSAVTQGADTYLIQALQSVGNGRWFRVVERGGIENLLRERQIIRQMRELHEGPNARPLAPLLFAGIIVDGGIIGYDTNISTGGAGARAFGIGGSTEYRTDLVTVTMRAVSVNTGEILVSITTTKRIHSYVDRLGVLRFVSGGTVGLEGEVGTSTNDSVNLAIQLAIQSSVREMIEEGARKGLWEYQP